MMGFSRRRRTSEAKFSPANSRVSTQEEATAEVGVSVEGCIPFPEQARKALSERSPFDSSTEDGTVSSRVSTLPVGFADILSKYSSNTRNKRHKKSHVGDGQTQSHNHHKSNNNIWAETEDYFRPVALDDVEHLATWSSSLLASCFSILPLSKNENVDTNQENLDTNQENVDTKQDTVVVDASNQENVDTNQDVVVDASNQEENVDTKQDIVEKKEDEQQHCMEIDSDVEKQMKPSSPELWSGLEWLLGSRNKILLTSERPSKKRKLLGTDAGLERLRVEHPYGEQVNSHVCHLCCFGDLNHHSNQLLVCDSCKFAVHQRCYGVDNVPVGPWLCSWCTYSGDDSESVSRQCLLCPKPGGALKPVAQDSDESNSSDSLKFVHLFCSQWMPEIYVEDTRTMEPVMNFKGIKETRKRLVCYLCKVKSGACVRCSHGTCRTAFHPICAREAGHRMEIWGKSCCENVELRAFCLKHSEGQDIRGAQQSNRSLHVAVGSNSSESGHLPMTLAVNKKLGHKNVENTSDEVENGETLLECDALVRTSKHGSQCPAHLSVSLEATEGKNKRNALDFVQALKKLVDRGKAIVSDVALEMGISSELLAGTLSGDQPPFPDLPFKIMKWLRNHAYLGTSQHVKSGDRVEISSKAEVAISDGPNSVVVAGHDSLSAGHVKSISSRRTNNNTMALKDNNGMCSSKGGFVQKNENGMVIDEVNTNSIVPNGDLREYGPSDRCHPLDEDCCSIEEDGVHKILSETLGSQDMGSSAGKLIIHQADFANGNTPEKSQAEVTDVSVRDAFANSNDDHLVSSVDAMTSAVPNFISGESSSYSSVHPSIQKRLMQLQNDINVKQEHVYPYSYDLTSDALELGQLVKSRKMTVFEPSPEDEVEGQLIYFQNKLLDDAAASKHYSDKLMYSIIKALPEELDATGKQKWDSVLVNQYLCGLREAKKQGRKEKRHKEAQAVLAAATAAAAASSRISSFRKDVHDEASHQEVPLKVMPRAKETLSRLAVARIPTEKPSGDFQLTSLLKENPQLCDVCKRSETMLNPILVCCNCKVSVHLGCYRNLKDPGGPWYCEFCRSLPSNSREESCAIASCGLCGGTTGAFRKSTDGQWLHAFCAEWLLESAYRRGQPNLVEGMNLILKERDICCVCHRKIGSCVKCNFGNCQSMFHPACARNSGFYMQVKTGGGKLQHKGYCEKHSLEQREKAEAQQHGPEELRSIKQIRVELERVRLLCERIVRREKLKRELILCSHDILSTKRDSAAFSVLVRSPFILPDVSSESATTSLRGYMDDNRSYSEAMQRSEEITMDSAISGKRRVMPPTSLDADQKTDDSSTVQCHHTRATTDRIPFSGKQLPHRPVSVVSLDIADENERKSNSRKHIETFQKELVMTADQASMQNQRLPKGFAYVPVPCLPKEKPSHETRPQEPDG